jgi:hypothetical protein
VRDPILAVASVVWRLAEKGPDHYDFAPPLEEGAIARFERRAGVVLPDEYRRFLGEVSSGGRETRLGPPHLMSLREAERTLERERGRLDAPFPLTSADAMRVIRADAKSGRRDPRPAIDRDLKDGVLPLMDLGGGNEMNFLVVTGPERGRIWAVWERGWSPLWRSVRGAPTPHGFSSWFRSIF